MRLNSSIFELIKMLQTCVYVSITVLFLTKSSRHTSSQHFSFQSLNSNTITGYGRCPRFIKVTTKTKVNWYSTLEKFEQTLHLVWVFLWPFYKKSVNVQYGISIFQCRYLTYSKCCQSRHCKEQLPKLLQKIWDSLFYKTTACDKGWLKNLSIYFLPL